MRITKLIQKTDRTLEQQKKLETERGTTFFENFSVNERLVDVNLTVETDTNFEWRNEPISNLGHLGALQISIFGLTNGVLNLESAKWKHDICNKNYTVSV